MFLIISIVTSCLRMATTVFFPVRATKLMKKKGSLLPLLSRSTSKNYLLMGRLSLVTANPRIMGTLGSFSSTCFLKF